MLQFLKNRRINIPIDPQKIAKFCFLVVLCEVGSTLQHTKSWTELEYGKVSKNKMAANMAAKNVNLSNFRDFLSISTRFFKKINYNKSWTKLEYGKVSKSG